MMEIPAEKECHGCCYLHLDMDYGFWDCNYPLKKYEGGRVDWDLEHPFDDEVPLRGPACLSAYPNGATVTITAKEGK